LQQNAATDQKGIEIMTNAKKLTLWSKRFTPAQGNHWKAEREVTEENCQAWLKIFRDDEPKVLFLVSDRKPSKD
jgi:hypothetical protein